MNNEVYIYELLEPESVIEKKVNIEKIFSSYKSIKKTIMIDELIRLHTEALANLYEQKTLNAVNKKLNNEEISVRILKLERKYADTHTEFCKIISE